MTNKIRELISINDLNKSQIIDILELAQKYKNGYCSNVLQNKVIASCFFEASTRTRLSFESAILRLSGKVIGFVDSVNTSLGSKGESLVDTFQMLSSYADALIIRHPQDGAARLASEICRIPVINAGDGANQHPSQTLLDLFSIQDSQGRLDDIHLGLMGDLKYSRTVHSLIVAARYFGMKLYFISPKNLRLDEEFLYELKVAGIQYSFHQDVVDIIDKLDCLYMTRLQRERFDNLIVDTYQLSLSDLQKAKLNLRILHPLPRQSELPQEIDNTPYAYYFEQAKNGVYVRQALLDILLAD